MTPEQQDLITRIEAAIGRANPSTVAEWRHCAVRFGVGSGSTKGALLQAVREVWGDDEIAVMPDENASGRHWRVYAGKSMFGYIDGRSEVDGLARALEAAP